MVAITPGGQLANSIQREITQGARISRDFQSEVSRRQLGERLNPPSAPDNGGISRALQSEIGRRQSGIPSPPSASPPATATPTIEQNQPALPHPRVAGGG
jgi:hypothetical protein